jgi:hypothetical protein
MLTPIVVNSLREYLEAVESIVAPWRDRWIKGAKAWFRGHADANWSLEPMLLRDPYLSGAHDFGQSFHALFKAQAHPFVTPLPNNALHWMMLSRHHGIPTRLLDWSESAATALYFAVRPPLKPAVDGAVWILDCLWLGKVTAGQIGVASTDAPAANKLADPGFTGGVPAPIPLLPDMISPRMVAQHSCFTLHGWETGALQRKADAEKAPRPLQEIRIQAAAKEGVRRSLATFGVDESTIFPDLDGLARSLRLRLAGDASGF